MMTTLFISLSWVNCYLCIGILIFQCAHVVTIRAPGYCTMKTIVPRADNPLAIPSPWNFPAEKVDNLTECSYFDTVCCAKIQTDILSAQLQEAAGVFASCAACFDNFKKFWCYFTCSPNQSLFLDIIGTWQKGNNTFVSNTTVTIERSYAIALYDSCKDVSLGLTGGSVVENLHLYNYTLFYSFFTTQSVKSSNVSIDVLYSEANTSMRVALRNCSDSCSCNDCEASCPLPAIPPSQRPWVLTITVSYSAFISFLVFVAFVLVVLVVSVWRRGDRIVHIPLTPMKGSESLAAVEGDAQGYDDRPPPHYSGTINESAPGSTEQKKCRERNVQTLGKSQRVFPSSWPICCPPSSHYHSLECRFHGLLFSLYFESHCQYTT